MSRIENLIACSKTSSRCTCQLTQKAQKVSAALWMLIQFRLFNRKNQIWTKRGWGRFDGLSFGFRSEANLGSLKNREMLQKGKDHGSLEPMAFACNVTGKIVLCDRGNSGRCRDLR